MIRDNAGVPVFEGLFAATFSLYEGPDTNDPVWTESWDGDGSDCLDSPEACVQVARGVFRLNLGSHAPLESEIFTSEGLWLGMSVEGEPELPHRRLGTTGYAFFAETALWCAEAASLDGLSSLDFEPAGAAQEAVAQHEAAYAHLWDAEADLLTGGEGSNADTLHTHVNLRVVAAAEPPFPCDPGQPGGLYLNTTENQLHMCTVVGWISGQGPPGASPFVLSGADAVYTQGNVGIGTEIPEAKLDVAGDARVAGELRLGGAVQVGAAETCDGSSTGRIRWTGSLLELCAGSGDSYAWHPFAGAVFNECESPETHDCDPNAICTDTNYAYTCACAPGFVGDGKSEESGGGGCADVDECAQGSHECAQTCENTDGGYLCGCDGDYTLGVDGHTCHPDCPELVAPIDGSLACTDASHTGSVCTFACEGAYILVGGAALTCGSDGSWSAEAPTCEIPYVPGPLEGSSAGSVGVAASMNLDRAVFPALLLPDGRVLVAGGERVGHPEGLAIDYGTAKAEIYDPKTNSWESTANDLSREKRCHTAVLLHSGKVLVTPTCVSDKSCELFDPATNAFTVTGFTNHHHVYPQASLLPDGRVLLFGGVGHAGGQEEGTYAEIYDPQTETWTETGSLNQGRFVFSGLPLENGNVLATGGLIPTSWGVADDTATPKTEIYDWTTGTWSLVGDLPVKRRSHSAVALLGGSALVVAGETSPNTTNNTSAVLTLSGPTSGTWAPTAPLPISISGSPPLVPLPDGTVLKIAGRSGGDDVSLDVFDPSDGTWAHVGNLNIAARAANALLLLGGQVIKIGGSYNGSWLTAVETWEPFGSDVKRPLVSKVAGSSSGTVDLAPGQEVVLSGTGLFGLDGTDNPEVVVMGFSQGSLYSGNSQATYILTPLSATDISVTFTLPPSGEIMPDHYVLRILSGGRVSPGRVIRILPP